MYTSFDLPPALWLPHSNFVLSSFCSLLFLMILASLDVLVFLPCAALDGQILQPLLPLTPPWLLGNGHVPGNIAGTALVIAFLGWGSCLNKICIFLNCSSTCLNFLVHPQLFSVISFCPILAKKKKKKKVNERHPPMFSTLKIDS